MARAHLKDFSSPSLKRRNGFVDIMSRDIHESFSDIRNGQFHPSHPDPFERKTPVCTTCNNPILDRYFLKITDQYWHVHCLSCSTCQASLSLHTSCYIRERKVFCRMDYFRSFRSRCCWRCGETLFSADWVRRAGGRVYHLACFSCSSCHRQLDTGEECAFAGQKLLCRAHFRRALVGKQTPSKRARTCFTSDQLQVMQTRFALEKSPDAPTLQLLAEQTGLSRRVIQVWFQNCRARQKKHIFPAVSSRKLTFTPATGDVHRGVTALSLVNATV